MMGFPTASQTNALMIQTRQPQAFAAAAYRILILMEMEQLTATTNALMTRTKLIQTYAVAMSQTLTVMAMNYWTAMTTITPDRRDANRPRPATQSRSISIQHN